jgi:4,5:9,10-diseco-3-hydroxy-5,9,17-trioxoandrosta-1(10),2-diene-4-oate hydrolase
MTLTIPGLTYESTSRTARVGDLTLHYHEAGEGLPLVLLHGGGPGASAWSNWKQNLPSLAGHFRVLAVDQPGYGRSDKPLIKGGMWEFYARAVRGLLDEIGLEQASFIGNSLGGGTTLKFALDYPDRTDRLVLMGPAGGMLPITSTWPSEGLRTLMAFYAPPGPSREKMQAIIEALMHNPGKVDPEVLEERYQAAIDPEAMATATAVFQAVQSGEPVLVAEELWRDVHRIGHRTLITWGREDRVLPLDSALFMAKYMPDARLHVFPNCGHWAQVEHAGEFERLVIDFLKADR